jgi:hypothetical protein
MAFFGLFRDKTAAERRAIADEKRAHERSRQARLAAQIVADEASAATSQRKLVVRAAKDEERAQRDEAKLARIHAEPHSSPSHHVGPCDAACRRGERDHGHRRRE